MESTLTKKKLVHNFFKNNLGYFYLFILFLTFSQLFFRIYHTEKFARHYKEQNKKRIMRIGLKTKKLFKVK